MSDQDRRYNDARMDSMEEDIREIRSEQKEMSKDVAAIREKIFNGFDKTVNETHAEVIELRKLSTKVDKLVTTDTQESRLSTCPLRDDLAKRMEKKFYVVVAIMTIVLSMITVASNLIGG